MGFNGYFKILFSVIGGTCFFIEISRLWCITFVGFNLIGISNFVFWDWLKLILLKFRGFGACIFVGFNW